MPRTLLVTNDFPPRPGGIQSFLHGLVSRLPPDDIVVYTSRWRGAEEWDAQQPFRVVREDTSVLLPTPGVRRRAAALLREHDAESVWFGAAAPLGLLAPALRRAGAQRIVATTHGHEVGWAAAPVARQVLRHIAGSVDVLTYLGDYTRSRLAAAVGSRNATKLQRLAPGVDTTMFRPGLGAELRASLGLADRPVVVCVSRLMPRKGQDVLIRALPAVQHVVPDAALLLVGGGPSRSRLESLAASTGVASSVTFTGSVPWVELPAYYGAGDVFAMPCRTRLGGLDVEGLGIVFLEAAACGLPVVAGDSGGAPETLRDGDTGYVVDADEADSVAVRLVSLLGDRAAAAAMGARGRAMVAAEWSWEVSAARVAELLTG
ncbi:MAG: phosphatidyl-myo-inositol dimannoside synthase [Frankiaceae bacterium]|nr:phosphatidyl-myo-inositol dimannoside synthase [Frankiaceae bacterium]